MWYPLLIQSARIVVIAFFGYACLVAAASWAIRTRRINPFSRLARVARRVTDPILAPVERRVIRLGGNPQDAGLWLVGIAVVGGLIVLSVVSWVVETVAGFLASIEAGPLGLTRFLVSGAFSVVMAALLVRVVVSWLGVSPYRRWMRPVMRLTDWIIEPLQRILPALGPLDFSPLVAYLLLYIARTLIVSWL